MLNTIGQNNPYLPPFTQDNNFVCPNFADEHAVAVAGIIHSQATLPPAFRGVSPGASLWCSGSCNGDLLQLEQSTNGAIGLGFRVINHSWGFDTGFTNLDPEDNFYDSRVFADRRVLVFAAGNEGGPCRSMSGRVTSPAKGYNVITVGNFDDMNTQAWDDSIEQCSSFVDPFSSNHDRIKPEVCAPGRLITTTLAFQQFGQWFRDRFSNNSEITGTSFSAPHVTGEAALIIGRAATTYGITSFKRKPELIKAIILASANHDVEFGIDRDGLGGISASWADDVVTGFLGGWGDTSFVCTDPFPYTIATIPLQVGLPTRIVICWSTNPSYANYNLQPSSDLGFKLVDPLGNRVATSNGFDNTFEWMDITPTIGGDYQIKILNRRCDMNPGLVAYAFWQNH